MTKAGTGFNQVINVERLGREPVKFEMTATRDECRKLAEELGILGLSKLTAKGALQRQPKTGLIELTAEFRATAVQECVVSLEEVSEKLEESITVFYTFDPKDLVVEEVDYVVGADEPDLPELIINNEIDLARIISEHIALALDPYPRLEKYRSEDQEDGFFVDDVDEIEKDVYKPFANLRDLMDKK